MVESWNLILSLLFQTTCERDINFIILRTFVLPSEGLSGTVFLPTADLKRLTEVQSLRGFEDTAGVLRPSEQDDRASVGLLAQTLDDVVVHLVVRSTGYLERRCYADVSFRRLAREHLDAVLAVAALRVDGGDVRPVGAFHHVHQRDRLEGIRRYRPREVIEPEERDTLKTRLDPIQVDIHDHFTSNRGFREAITTRFLYRKYFYYKFFLYFIIFYYIYIYI